MASKPKDGVRTGQQPAVYGQLLLFPERAEYLGQFEGYRVRLEHWRELSTQFRTAFEGVFERRSAAVLLVHGAQGTGKTLFARKLEADFQKASRSVASADQENLWHVLSGGDPIDLQKVSAVTPKTAFRRVAAEPEWLTKEGSFAKEDTHSMRVFVLDDFHKDVFQRELASLSQGEYLRLKAEGKAGVAIDSVAARIVEELRDRFSRSLFVLLSNDASFLQQLEERLELSHAGLARRIDLPLPEPGLKEEIVRTNTNRLNPRSYWYCLDQGGPDEKAGAYRTLRGSGGFIDSFRAIDRALGAGASKRPGRPANKNLLTFVTLGSDPLAVDAFFRDHELVSTSAVSGTHVSAWLFREEWASAFGGDADADYARRARLVESEFAFRWIAFDARATWCLCSGKLSPSFEDVIRQNPKIGKRDDLAAEVRALDSELRALTDLDGLEAFTKQFRDGGQGRSRDYEAAIAKRFSAVPFGRTLEASASVKPDLIFSEYQACAVTNAKSDDAKALEEAIRRTCHVVEFTAHLQVDMRGVDDYLRGKVGTYGSLLESV